MDTHQYGDWVVQCQADPWDGQSGCMGTCVKQTFDGRTGRVHVN